jgi:nucleotide-binding universal stress UspA family protein
MTRISTSRESRKVLAAVNDDSSAGAVLVVADTIASLFTATVQAVHVGEDHAAVAEAAQGAGVALRTVAGQPVEALARVAADEDVVAVVIGARGASAKRPPGSTALGLISVLQKPVVVVPADVLPGPRIESVLVPQDGTARSAAALKGIVQLASEAELQIVVAHVHLRQSLPAFSDHLPHEVRAWSEEFVARYCPTATDATLESRVGNDKPSEHVLDILRRTRCDLVALGWSQDLAHGHAAVVRQLLAESPVPVLLAPASDDPALQPAGAAPPAGSD